MTRSLKTLFLTVCIAMTTASSANACIYIPWLDPFAWLGLYGNGYGGYGGCYGGGCQGYGGGYGYPGYGAGYQAPLYTPSYPMMGPSAPMYPQTPGCNCGASLPQPQYAVSQVPVTTYRAVTRQVPQTTYRTVTQYVPTTAYQPSYQPNYATAAVNPYQYGTPVAPRTALTYPTYAPTYATAAPITAAVPTYPQTALAPTYTYPTYPTQAYSTPQYSTPTYPTQSYSTPLYGATTPIAAPLSAPYSAPLSTPTVVPGTTYPSVGTPTYYGPTQNIATPGDINGDHEYPTQSAVRPLSPPTVRQVSYGVRPGSGQTYTNAVR